MWWTSWRVRWVRMLTRFVALIEKHAAKQSPTRIEELVKIFVHATKVCWMSLLEALASMAGRTIGLTMRRWRRGFGRWRAGLTEVAQLDPVETRETCIHDPARA